MVITIIPYLEQIGLDIEELSVEIDDNLPNKKTSKNNSLLELVDMKQVLDSSKLLEMILENVPKDFTYKCSGTVLDSDPFYLPLLFFSRKINCFPFLMFFSICSKTVMSVSKSDIDCYASPVLVYNAFPSKIYKLSIN